MKSDCIYFKDGRCEKFHKMIPTEEWKLCYCSYMYMDCCFWKDKENPKAWKVWSVS